MSLTDQQSIITQVAREDCDQIKSANTTEKGRRFSTAFANVNK